MGTVVKIKKNDKYVVHNTCNDTESHPITRGGAILWLATDLSPYALVEAFYVFPGHWGAGSMRVHAVDHDAFARYMKWMGSVKTSADVFAKYRECVAELKRQSEEGGDDSDFGI